MDMLTNIEHSIWHIIRTQPKFIAWVNYWISFTGRHLYIHYPSLSQNIPLTEHFFFVLIIDGYSYAKYLLGSECGGKRDILRCRWNPGWLTDHSMLWVWPSLYHLPHQTEGFWDILSLKRKWLLEVKPHFMKHPIMEEPRP